MQTKSIKDKVIEKFGSQTEVARICGITQGAVSQWGAYIPSKYIGVLVAAGADPKDFYGIETSTDAHAT